MAATYDIYWKLRYRRIQELIAISHCLESLLVRRLIYNTSKMGGGSYRVENGCLIPHSYTKYDKPIKSKESDPLLSLRGM